MVESEDTHYYDFWPGTWVEVVDGRADTSATTFTVRRSVHPAAFEEDWRLVYNGASHQSTALRAWDQVNNRWMFTWISDNALFQVWEGQKRGDHWYIKSLRLTERPSSPVRPGFQRVRTDEPGR